MNEHGFLKTEDDTKKKRKKKDLMMVQEHENASLKPTSRTRKPLPGYLKGILAPVFQFPLELVTDLKHKNNTDENSKDSCINSQISQMNLISIWQRRASEWLCLDPARLSTNERQSWGAGRVNRASVCCNG